MFFRNIGIPVQGYMVSQLRRLPPEYCIDFQGHTVRSCNMAVQHHYKFLAGLLPLK
jgi:hypothetical protein